MAETLGSKLSTFIDIDNNLLVNPDSIDAIEQKLLNGKQVLNIYVNGVKFVSRRNPSDVLKQLNIFDRFDETNQFWAGR